MARLHTLVRLAPLAAVLASAACDRAPTAAPAPAVPPALAQELVCEATVASGQVVCRGTEPTASGGARAVILGGQGSYVRLTSTNAHYDGSAVFSVDVTVQNLIIQTLGTRDGTTADAEGVRVFIASGPTATGGTGVVSVANPDGHDVFTASAQPYFQYPGLLRTDSTSAAKTWRFHAPSTVTTFSFRVYVAAAVARPNGWVQMDPVWVNVGVGASRTLSVIVRDALGRQVPAGPVTWSSAHPSLATIDSAGVLRGHAHGSAVITATVGGLTTSNAVGVVTGGDRGAPAVRGITLSRTEVDVSRSEQTVRVLVSAADAGVGVKEVQALLISPDGTPPLTCNSSTLIGGSVFSGTWRCIITIPRAAAAGTWGFREVTAVDSLGNLGLLSGFELQGSGSPSTIQVTSTDPDTLAPEVSAFTVSPRTVDVSGADATLQVELATADAGVGVKEVYAVLDGPILVADRGCALPTLVGGTVASGTWRCTITIPRGSAPGAWTFREMGAVDSLGNRRALSTEQMQAAGYATTVQVTSAGADVTPPAVTGFSFSPDSVAVTNAAATVEVRIGASDFGSGVKEVYARLDGSGGVIWYPCALPTLASGTAANGTWRCTITIPRASASGPWTFRTIAATDHVGNTVELMPEEIYARRYPNTVWVRN